MIGLSSIRWCRAFTALVALAVLSLLGEGAISAASYFSGDYDSTSCPSGYGCVQGRKWTQGYNYGKDENHWSAVTRGNGETTPTYEMRNRNKSSKRNVVIRVWRNDRWQCAVLEFDDRTWVVAPGWAHGATEMKGAGNTTGCEYNRYI